MQEVLAFALESRGSVRHDTFALSRSDLAAEIRFAGFAEFALATFRCTGRTEISLASVPLSLNTYYSATTLSPGLTFVTPSPTDSTIPAPS